MTDKELAHLIKMANQIAINLAYGDSLEQSAARVSDHIVRFWAASMKNKLKIIGDIVFVIALFTALYVSLWVFCPC